MWLRVLTTLCLFCSYGFAYKAAVLEHYPQPGATPEETISNNLDSYGKWADTARSQSVDILVFPEYGLTTVVENPENYAFEIDSSTKEITELSAIAKERMLYIVVNVLEKEKKDDETKYYNTNLVFDKNGNIILKYRKINLYNETKLTPGSSDQNLTFSTDFGITFAIFTCFDILVRHPSRTVLQNRAITDVVFPTAWISKMPFYTSLSVQHGYAVSNGVNLLAANYATPRNGRGGSGIYLADGTIAETYIGDSASSKIIVQEVKSKSRQDVTVCPTKVKYEFPTDTPKSNVSNYIMDKAFNAPRYQFEDIDLTQNHTETRICDGDFCCTFDIIVNSINSSEFYKVMAFDGVVDYDVTNPNINKAHIRFCSLVACEDSTSESCGARIKGTTRFRKITVTGNLPRDDTAFYTPVTVNSYLLPLRDTKFCDSKNGTNSTFVQLTTLAQQEFVLAFGLSERTDAPIEKNNPVDDDDSSGSGGSKIQVTFFFLMFLITMKYVVS